MQLRKTKKILSLGIMTGTSADGADFALSHFTILKNKITKESLIATQSFPFPNNLRKDILKAQMGTFLLSDSGAITRDYSEFLAKCIIQFIKKHSVSKYNLILSVHGQTVWHSPPTSSKSRGHTLQLLDPAILSVQTGITIIYNFRSADMARYGQGAPLVPFYHWLRSQDLKLTSNGPIAIHNIGGIANLSVIDENINKMIGFDTGPGNALIDLAIESLTHGKKKFDDNGRVAISQMRVEIINKTWSIIKSHPYFKKSPPKSTGRELFNHAFIKKYFSKSTAVAEATLLTAYTISDSYRRWVFKQHPRLKTIYIAGGGAKNRFLYFLIKEEIKKTNPNIIVKLAQQGFSAPEFLEAMAFARFGVHTLLQIPIVKKATTKARQDSWEASIFPSTNFSNIVRFSI